MEWKMPTNRRKVLASALVIVFAASHDAQAQDVQRVDVREAGLVGHFYAASGASGRTGVLMLGGSEGGYPDEAAARDLARAGYPVLALAYFRDRGGDPPELEQKQLRKVPLEYIFKALDWLEARPEVRAGPHRPDGRIAWGGIGVDDRLPEAGRRRRDRLLATRAAMGCGGRRRRGVDVARHTAALRRGSLQSRHADEPIYGHSRRAGRRSHRVGHRSRACSWTGAVDFLSRGCLVAKCAHGE